MKKMIKDFFAGLMVLVFLFGAMGWAGYIETTYDMVGTVWEKVDGNWLIEDSRGEIWGYHADNLHKGDEVKITFFDNHTHRIYDDEIVKVKIIKNHK